MIIQQRSWVHMVTQVKQNLPTELLSAEKHLNISLNTKFKKPNASYNQILKDKLLLKITFLYYSLFGCHSLT